MTDQGWRVDAAVRAIPTWWPLIVAMIGYFVLGAQAYGQIGEHARRLTELEKAQPAIALELRNVNVGMARLEGKLDAMADRDGTERQDR